MDVRSRPRLDRLERQPLVPTSVLHPRLGEIVEDHLIKGRAELERWYNSADNASDAGTLPSVLEDAEFGASAGQGSDLWSNAASVRSLLNTGDAGGLKTFLAKLDKGS